MPALILDDGSVIVDSYVIVEYLDELAGGKLIPASGPERWRVKSDHSMLQGMTDAMLLCRYETGVRPKELQWQKWIDDQWDRPWQGLTRFEHDPDFQSRPFNVSQIALVSLLVYADFRFPDCGWRKAFPNLAAFQDRMLERPSVKATIAPAA
jgi:glutathione S-transferase